jgi:hypothetical protein
MTLHVMRGLVPRIHALRVEDVDGRDVGERSDAVLRTAMPGHDEFESQIPNTSLRKRAIEAFDCASARSSSGFFGVEKPCLVPL